jgi:hypothetical protein
MPPLSTRDAGFAISTSSISIDEAWSSRVAVDPMQNFGLGQLPPDIKDLVSLHSSQRTLAVDLLKHREASV